MSDRRNLFQPGNKFGRGRPKGSRNKSTSAAQRLLEENGEPIMRQCIVSALRGDKSARRLCMERLVPVRREPLVKLKLRTITTATDVADAINEVLHAIGRGKLAPAEGQDIVSIVGERRKAIDTEEHEARLQAVESKTGLGPPRPVTREGSV
jgi:hypothetical protein